MLFFFFARDDDDDDDGQYMILPFRLVNSLSLSLWALSSTLSSSY
jgi:hypothetical protein